MDPAFDIEKNIAQKIEEVGVDRRALRESIDGVQAKLDSLFTRMGNKPRETDEQLVKQTKDLEYWHSTTTQDNASERKFMQDMDKLKKRRQALVEFAKMQEIIDEMKAHKKDLQQSLRDKEKHIDELYQAVRKLKTAGKVGCDPREVVERVVVASDDQVPTNMFRQLAETFNVDMSSTKVGGSRAVRVQGSEDAVSATFVRIEELLQNVAQEVSVSSSSIYCLLMMSAALLNRIEKDYSVRIDLSRSALTCKITGTPDNVRLATSEIESIQSATVQVKFESSALPFIIGKGGSGLRSIEQENCVHLDVDREKSVIIVTGFVDDVAAAAELIKDTADGNRQVEEILKIPRHIFLGCLQRDNGTALKEVRSDYPAVVIQTLKALEKHKENGGTGGGNGGRPMAAPPNQAALDAAVGVDKSTDFAADACEFLLFKGPSVRAIPARNAIQAKLDEYMASMVTIAASSDSVGFVVGKKGVRIDAIRKQYPSASIDVGQEAVYVYSSSTDERNAIAEEVRNIIEENNIEIINYTEEAARSLVNPKAADFRLGLEQKLGLNVNIDIDKKQLKLRGRGSAIQQGVALLRDFEVNHSIHEMPVSEEDCSALSSGGEKSASKDIETQFCVEIYVSRKNHTVKIRGHCNAVAQAAVAITRLLSGEAGSESQLIPYDKTDLRFLIGKGGETISNFERDNNVRIDILKSSGFMRVRGKTGEQVNVAVESIKTFLGDVIDITRIPVDLDAVSANELRKSLISLKEMFPLKVLSAPLPSRPKPSGKDNKDSKQSKNRKPKGKKTVAAAAVAVSADESATADATTPDATSPVANEAVVEDEASVHSEPRAEKEKVKPDNVVVMQGKRRVLKAAAEYFETLLSGCECYKYCLSEQLFKILYPQLSSSSRVTGVEKFGATLTFDSSKRLVLLTGSSSSMIKSKAMFFRFLDEFMPGHFATYALPAACLSLFNADKIDQLVSSIALVDIQYDFQSSCLRLSSDSGGVAIKNAVDMLEAHRSEWSDKYATIKLEDVGAIPFLVGKGGAVVSEIEKSTSVTIQIDAKAALVTVQGQTKEACQAGADKVRSRLDQFAREQWSETVSDRDALSSLIGSGGSKINQLRADTGTNIEVNVEAGTVRVTGPEEAVKKAKQAIKQALDGHMENNHVVKLKIPIAAFPLIVGKKGATIRDLQTSTKVRKIDLLRDGEELVIRGSASCCAEAEAKVKALLKEAGFDNKPVAPVVHAAVEEPVAEKLASSGGYFKSNGNPVAMSKSHLKRLRRKAQQSQEGNEAIDSSDDEEEEDVSPQPMLAASSHRPIDTNITANEAAMNALLHDLGVSTLSSAAIVNPPSLHSTPAGVETAFTPFSESSVVISPVHREPIAFVPAEKSAPPPGFTMPPVRSMRSARVGIIGSSGSSKASAVSASAQPLISNSSASNERGVAHPAPISEHVAPNSTGSTDLLSLLLDESAPSHSAHKSKSTGSAYNNRATAPVEQTAQSSASSSGYYKSKGGISVRLV